ncbi:MAG: tetratricopeptide repeat protein, partial [Planctomycetota bacterium]
MSQIRLQLNRTALLVLTALVLACGGGWAADGVEDLAARCEAYLKGEYPLQGKPGALYEFRLAQAEADLKGPVAELALRRLGQSSLVDFPWTPAWTQRLRTLGANPQASAEVRFQANRRLAHALRREGKVAEAETLEQASGRIGSWQAGGPFGRWGGAAFTTPFAPETGVRHRSVRHRKRPAWLELSPSPFDGRTYPYERVRPGMDGVVYLRTALKVDQPLTGRLRLTMGASWRLWVNGTLLHEHNRLTGYRPAEQVVSVSLQGGLNRFLIKVYSSGQRTSLHAVLSDGEGRPIPVSVVDAEGEWGEAVKGASTAATANTPGALFELEKALAEAPRPTPALQAVYALHCREQGLADRALAAIRLAASGGESPVYELMAAELARDAHHLPPEVRLNESRRRFRNCLALDPSSVPARLALAEMLRKDEQPRDALAMLNDALKQEPGSLAIHRRRIDIAIEEGWKVEARRWEAEMGAVAGSEETLSY